MTCVLGYNMMHKSFILKGKEQMGKDLQGNELGTGITQRKTGIYELRYINKLGKRISVTSKDLKTLMEKYSKQLVKEEKEYTKSPYTLDEWFDEWLNIYKSSTKEATQLIYKRVYNQFLKEKIGSKNLSEITNKDIQSILNENSSYSYEVKNKIRILVTDMYNKAFVNDYISNVPTRGLRVSGNKKRKPILTLTQEQQKLFFDYAKGTFHYNLYVVAINTGLRLGELVCLTEKDLDFDNKLIHVKKTLKYDESLSSSHKHFFISTPKTESSYRDVPMTSFCEEALKKQLVQKQVVTRKAPVHKKVNKEFEDLIFTTRHNTPINAEDINSDIRKIINDINCIQNELEELPKFSMHTFRHTFATRCFEANIPLKTIQAYLGHANLSMTSDLYTSILDETKTKQIGNLEELLEEIDGVKVG